jgi:hypothetical protein
MDKRRYVVHRKEHVRKIEVSSHQRTMRLYQRIFRHWRLKYQTRREKALRQTQAIHYAWTRMATYTILG